MDSTMCRSDELVLSDLTSHNHCRHTVQTLRDGISILLSDLSANGQQVEDSPNRLSHCVETINRYNELFELLHSTQSFSDSQSVSIESMSTEDLPEWAVTMLEEAVKTLEERIEDINSNSTGRQRLIESLQLKITDIRRRHGQEMLENKVRYNELYEQNQRFIRKAEEAHTKLIEANEWKEHSCSRVEELFESNFERYLQLDDANKKNADLEKRLQELQAEHDSFVDRVGQAQTMEEVEKAMKTVLGMDSPYTDPNDYNSDDDQSEYGSSPGGSSGYDADDGQSEYESFSIILDRPLCESPEEMDSQDEYRALKPAALRRRMSYERVRPQASLEYSEDVNTKFIPASSINGRPKLHLIIPENISEVEEVFSEFRGSQQISDALPTGPHPSRVLPSSSELGSTLCECISPAMLLRSPRALVRQELKYYKQLIASEKISACTVRKAWSQTSIQHPIATKRWFDNLPAYEGKVQRCEVEPPTPATDCGSNCSTPDDSEENPAFMRYWTSETQ